MAATANKLEKKTKKKINCVRIGRDRHNAIGDALSGFYKRLAAEDGELLDGVLTLKKNEREETTTGISLMKRMALKPK